MNRYIHYKAVGNMYVGCCVSGWDRMGTDFALSNPYFDFSHLRDEKEATQSNLEEWIKERMPTGESLDESIFALFKLCLASFVYHKNSGWLENNAHSQNAIRCSYFWRFEIFLFRIGRLPENGQ